MKSRNASWRQPLAANAWLRYDVVRPRLHALRPRSVLEIGPGRGGFAVRIAPAVDRYVGVETSTASGEVANDRLRQSGCTGATIVRDLSDVEVGDGFDLVCAFEVIEHLDDDARALADWVELTTPGGHVMISAPAHPDRYGPHDVLAGHHRRYVPDEIVALARSAGLTDVEVVVYGCPFGYVLEIGRDLLAKRALARAGGVSSAERTAQSGGLYQPSGLVAVAVAIVIAPARWIQRLFLGRGTGLVLTGRRPPG